MSFEENKKYITKNCILCEMKMPEGHKEITFWLSEHFISKQKIREAIQARIEIITKKCKDETLKYNQILLLSGILKELGLDEARK